MLQTPELHIEKEFEDLVYDGADCTPIFIPFLYKKFRRDGLKSKLKCPACNEGKNGNKEGSLDCPYCLGAGYQWDQGIAEGWIGKPEFSIERTLVASISDRQAESAFYKIYLYTKKDVILADTDIILIPQLEGTKIKVPIESQGIYSVFDDFNFRANQSQAEYNRYRLSTTFDNSFKHLIKGK